MAEQKPSTPMVEIGTTGLRQSGGFLHEEFLPALKGNRAVRVFREMEDNEPVVGAILLAFSSLVQQAPWMVQAAAEDQKAEDIAEFVRSALFDDMDGSFEEVIAEICSMFTFGFAPLEIVWKKRNGERPRSNEADSLYSDGLIGIKKLSLRAQETIYSWEFDDHGNILGLRQQPYVGAPVFIPIEKLLLFRTTPRKNNPQGRSILRNAYRPWYYKKRIEEVEGIGIERDLAGYPILRIPGRLMSSDADAAEKAAYANYQIVVSNIRRDQHEGLVLPSDRDENGNPLFELSLLSASGSRQVDTRSVREGYGREIAMSVLADFIYLGQGSTGSFALSSDKTEMFANAIGGFMRSVQGVFNRQLIPRLMKMNGLPVEYTPVLSHGDIEKQNLTEVSGFVSTLASAGAAMFPDRDLENHLRKLGGLPLLAEEAEGDEMPEAESEEEEAKEDAGS